MSSEDISRRIYDLKDGLTTLSYANIRTQMEADKFADELEEIAGMFRELPSTAFVQDSDSLDDDDTPESGDSTS